MMRVAAILGVAALALLAAACSAPATTSDRGEVLPPPAALKMNGVDPVPQALVRAGGGYANFRGVRLLDWQPQGRGLLVGFERDSGGDEAALIYRFDLESGAETWLTEPGRRYGRGPFNQAGTASARVVFLRRYLLAGG